MSQIDKINSTLTLNAPSSNVVQARKAAPVANSRDALSQAESHGGHVHVSLTEDIPTLEAPNVDESYKQGQDQGQSGSDDDNDDGLFGDSLGGSSLGLGDSANESIVNIVEQALVVQISAGEDSWSNMWKTSSESMNAAIDLAPVMAQATINNWNAQAAATQDDADMAKDDGIFSIVIGVGTIGMGVASTWGETDAEDTLQEKNDGTEPTVSPAGANPGTSAGAGIDDVQADAENANQKSTEAVEQNMNGKKTPSQELADTANAAKGKASTWFGKIMEGFKAGAEKGQLVQVIGQGIQGLTIDSHYNSDKATQQTISGQNQALSQVCEQYAQYYNQDFSRTDSLRQGAQQNIDYALNILQQASNTVTQTVTSMFRG